ncbi:MAG: deaminase [Bacteroidota bacterium]
MAASVLVLDLDGPLVDTTAMHAEAFWHAAEAFGISLPPDRFVPEIGKGTESIVRDVFGSAFEAAHGKAYRDQANRYVRQLVAEPLRVVDGARRLIDAGRAAGLTVALASSASEDILDMVVTSVGWDVRDLFDFVAIVSNAEARPSEPDLVRLVAEHFEVPPVGCVLVGATIHSARVARRGGASFVGVATGAWSESELASAGARVTYSSTSALVEGFRDSLGAAAPGSSSLTVATAEALMEAAFAEARAAAAAGDAPIGAVIAQLDGHVLARGRNASSTGGDRLLHAEMQALHALNDASREGLVLATTLEPCAMCLGAATEMGVHAVLYGIEAPPNGAVRQLDPLPGRTLPLCAQWGDREQARDVLRLGASKDFVSRLLASLDA